MEKRSDGDEAQTSSAPRYTAFVSYSHSDSKLVRRLHRELETYKVPRKLVGLVSPVLGKVPRRLMPIFLDREELPSSADLSTVIQDALDRSQTLIVACSPDAAASRWVNEEVVHFKKKGHEGRVMAVILSGEPHGSENPNRGLPECFCPALRRRVNADGGLSNVPAEPVAADLRKVGDGWRLAKLKLVAGILGLPFDEIRRREQERERQRMVRRGVVALSLVVCALAVTHEVRKYVKKKGAESLVAHAQASMKERRYLTAALFIEALSEEDATTKLADPVIGELAKAFPARLFSLKAPTPAPTLEHAVFSKDGKWLFAAGGSGKLYAWDLQSAAPVAQVHDIGKRPLSRLAPERVERKMWIAGGDGTVAIWDVVAQKVIQRIAASGTNNRVAGLFSDEGRQMFATAGNDGLIKVWKAGGADSAGVPAALTLTEHDDLAKAVAFSPDGLWVASGGFDKTLRIASLSNPQAVRVVRVGDSLNCQVFTSDSKWVLVAGRGGSVKAYEVTGEGDAPVWTLPAHSNRINDMVLTPDGKSFLTASDDGSIRKWALADRSLELLIEDQSTLPSAGHKDEVKFLGVAMSADGRMIAGSQSDGNVSLWAVTPAAATHLGELLPHLQKRLPVRWINGAVVAR